jgi:hypothetical protein
VNRDSVKYLVGLLALFAVLFACLWGLLWVGKQWEDKGEECRKAGGTLSRTYECVQVIDLDEGKG